MSEILPGHCLSLQVSYCDDSPSHILPNTDGFGLLHMRLLYLIPGPQELLHIDQSFHLLQPPFTKNYQGIYFEQLYVIS